ncbi:hypothetical protein GCM10020216_062160 [Nonomuraea helvata]
MSSPCTAARCAIASPDPVAGNVFAFNGRSPSGITDGGGNQGPYAPNPDLTCFQHGRPPACRPYLGWDPFPRRIPAEVRWRIPDKSGSCHTCLIDTALSG